METGEKYTCASCRNEVTVNNAGSGALVCCGLTMQKVQRTPDVDLMYAYNQLAQRQIHEDNQFNSRTNTGLVLQSLLLVAFFQSVGTGYYPWTHYAIPLMGMLTSLILANGLRESSKFMRGLYDALCTLERDLVQMKNNKVRPFSDIAGMTLGDKHPWKRFMWVIPSILTAGFMLMWAICIIATN